MGMDRSNGPEASCATRGVSLSGNPTAGAPVMAGGVAAMAFANLVFAPAG